jgi:hypothetical protein
MASVPVMLETILERLRNRSIHVARTIAQHGSRNNGSKKEGAEAP